MEALEVEFRSKDLKIAKQASTLAPRRRIE